MLNTEITVWYHSAKPRDARNTLIILHTFLQPLGRIETNNNTRRSTSFQLKFHENNVIVNVDVILRQMFDVNVANESRIDSFLAFQDGGHNGWAYCKSRQFSFKSVT